MIGVVLAGGAAARIGGGDKGNHVVGGLTVLDRLVDRLRGQCRAVALSANGDPARFGRLGCRVIADAPPLGRGPLAGILAALDALAAETPAIVTVPTDTPFLPADLIMRLAAAAQPDAVACATSGGRRHPTIALWPVHLREDLRTALDAGERKVGAFLSRHPVVEVDWPTAPYDPFFNINSPADLAAADAIAQRHAARLAVPPVGPL